MRNEIIRKKVEVAPIEGKFERMITQMVWTCPIQVEEYTSMEKNEGRGRPKTT